MLTIRADRGDFVLYDVACIPPGPVRSFDRYRADLPTAKACTRVVMLNTYWAMILPALASPFGVFLMRQFMCDEKMIPSAMLESARIDGAGWFRIYWSIVMPLVKPAWLTLIIFTFQSLWGGSGSRFIFTEAMKPLPTVLSQISSSGIARAGVGSAVAVLMMIPPIVTFIISQSNVMETMSHAGIKG